MIHHKCHEDIKLNRIYVVRIDDTTEFWVNADKSADDFQRDMLYLVAELKNLDPATLDHRYRRRMEEMGYTAVEDLVADSFQVRIVHTSSRFVPGG